jgi:hypothetical protein
MRLIKFTSEGEPLHLNLEHVESVQREYSGFTPSGLRVRTGRTVIRSVNYESYSVDEDLETVVRMLTEMGEPLIKSPILEDRSLQFTEDELKDIAVGKKTAHIVLGTYSIKEINSLCKKHQLRIKTLYGSWVQALSHWELVASGTPRYPATQYGNCIEDTREEFHRRWDAAHPDAPWASDPEVTVIYFEKEN